jgi:hypothetical protein
MQGGRDTACLEHLTNARTSSPEAGIAYHSQFFPLRVRDNGRSAGREVLKEGVRASGTAHCGGRAGQTHHWARLKLGSGVAWDTEAEGPFRAELFTQQRVAVRDCGCIVRATVVSCPRDFHC